MLIDVLFWAWFLAGVAFTGWLMWDVFIPFDEWVFYRRRMVCRQKEKENGNGNGNKNRISGTTTKGPDENLGGPQVKTRGSRAGGSKRSKHEHLGLRPIGTSHQRDREIAKDEDQDAKTKAGWERHSGESFAAFLRRRGEEEGL